MNLCVQVCRPAIREESWPAHTIDVSTLGARLMTSVGQFALGEVLEISHRQRRSVFRVAWVGESGTATEGQSGVECLNPENNVWDLDQSEQMDDDSLLQEISVARAVQSNLMPREQPPLRTLDYSGSCMQARIVGGDYYDFLDLDAGQVGFVLADVAGKGVPAALLMANLQGSVHSHSGRVDSQSLPRWLASVNRHLYHHTDSRSYSSLFFGCYDDDTRVLTYVNCGHNPPLLLRQGGVVERLTPTATVLGLFKEWECSVGQARLESGDVLTLFTDGVTETTGNTGEEFGEDRLLGAVHASRNLEAASILRNVEQAVRQFRSSTQPEDDVTLVVARVQ
jgi:serine phosphatase RsbU (regulator of sigma subunit)